MGTTPNLLLAHIVASQNQKEVTANAGFDGLDTALTDLISEAISGTAFTLPAADARAKMFFTFTGALTADNTITLPATKKLYVVLNSTTGGFRLIFKAGTGVQTVTVPDSKPHLLYCDGLNTVYSVAVLASDVNGIDAGAITTGLLALARGGTGANLSASGGVSQVLKQVAAGAAVTVGQLAASDLSNGVTGTGAVVLTSSPSLTTPTINGAAITGTVSELFYGGLQAMITYAAPATSATAQWVKLGTFTLGGGQSGQTIRIVLFLHGGFSSANSQDATLTITLKASNGTSTDANGFAGNSSWYAIGDNQALSAANIVKWKANGAGNAATAYDLFLNLPTFTDNSSYYVTHIGGGATWTALNTGNQVDPGVGSSTVLVAPIDFTTVLLSSQSTNPALSGFLRLASADSIAWRNNANNADITLSKNASDQLVANAVDVLLRRPIANQGTALVAADFALSAGWGTGASVIVAVGSTDTRGQITVTVGTTPGANPTITLTFKNGAYTAAPFALAKQEGGTQALASIQESTTTTTLTVTFVGTPIAANTVIITWICLG